MGDVILEEEAVLARGRARLIFQHPARPDRLIKVMRAKTAKSYDARARPFSHGRRFGRYKVHAKEIVHFLECAARRPDVLSFCAPVYGLEPTNLGMGLVCQKIDDGRGRLAPTLGDLHRAGRIGPEHGAMLERLEAALVNAHFVVHDLKAANIVVAGEGGAERLVVVDGFGDPWRPPLRRLSFRLNRFLLRRDIRRLRRQLGLEG
jgi:hypothetical protein